MAAVRVQTTIGDSLVAIEVTGDLGDKLAQCKTAADVIGVFSQIVLANFAVNHASSFGSDSRPTTKKAWMFADNACVGADMSRAMIQRLKETPVTVIDLDK
ncbi:MAG: hypothetical protein UU72_C0050G0011 [candidate division WWE3 bacterium GW2011_GWB1_41_6]|uniref:Uncharacterized protein n=2 Tax=Bacteria candidate phyla TaxID=1783234 RepID=A0A1F7YPU4_9BACT|nr:MAG: hypothetical protein UU72_C0050G0011 [candidate division WWE3 bacterium GW2011_GWB1_41_6]OGM29361.1 MAG: hypothetical protein A2801_01575 [Candidatus Woesebacteria bacterium RIFCSPHIGHO2_01_FULL_41_10]